MKRKGLAGRRVSAGLGPEARLTPSLLCVCGSDSPAGAVVERTGTLSSPSPPRLHGHTPRSGSISVSGVTVIWGLDAEPQLSWQPSLGQPATVL